ncbi:hypothetical protein [Streptomyces sp. ST1015]|uniref:hypothetical protein n=1 Tax=unclassified Streptomyces TaxID=2593676 RepID=UPI00223B8E6D|nr:hypothetical protein [Streptomyces sp. ST1015]
MDGDLATWPGLPHVLLFLEWEATKYPLEWTQHAKAWGTKQGLIREVARARQKEAIKAKLTDLVEIVVHRAYRCKDREYVRVARAVDSADLRARLDRAANSDSPWARRHARSVLWLLNHPDLPNTPPPSCGPATHPARWRPSLAVGVLRLSGVKNIAAGLRRNTRDTRRPLGLA